MGFLMIPMNINTNTYVITATTTSAPITITPLDSLATSIVIYNAGAVSVFIVSGGAGGLAAPTAVFPTSATGPIGGQIIPAGSIVTYSKNVNDTFISTITASGTATLYIAIGCGQ